MIGVGMMNISNIKIAVNNHATDDVVLHMMLFYISKLNIHFSVNLFCLHYITKTKQNTQGSWYGSFVTFCSMVAVYQWMIR